jgi:hypothetical protein
MFYRSGDDIPIMVTLCRLRYSTSEFIKIFRAVARTLPQGGVGGGRG